MDGLQRLLDFMSRLEDKGITFSLHRFAPDHVTVCATLIGARLEAYFDPQGMTFSIFKGREWVEDNSTVLDQLFADHWDDNPEAERAEKLDSV